MHPAGSNGPDGWVVVRFGALAGALRTWRDRAASELVALQRQGKRIVVVHDGGSEGRTVGAQLLDAVAAQGGRGVAAPAMGGDLTARAEALAPLAARGIVLVGAERPAEAASGFAAALGAESLLVLDATGPVMVHGRPVPRLGSQEAALLLAQEELPQPMRGAVRACAWAVARGVGQARIVDVRIPGALLRGADPQAVVGTAVVSAAAAATPLRGP